MSDSPGGNPQPRDRRRGKRPPRNRHRPQPGQNEAPPREERGPRRRRKRDRDRDRPRREQRPGAAPVEKPKTLGQKLLTILTFGLVRSKTRPKPPAARGAGNAAPKKQAAPVPPADLDAITSTRLHVGNLHYDISESDLLDLFKGIGPVKSVDIVYNGRTHRSRGFGFVEFISLDDARRAVSELHGLPYMQRPLLLGPARDRGQDEREADTPD